MKTISQTKSDIEDLKGKIKLARTLGKIEAALSKKILTLNKAIIYLESGPEKEHLLSQKQSVTRKLEIYAQRYEV